MINCFCLFVEIVFDNLFESIAEINSYSCFSSIENVGLDEVVIEKGLYGGGIIIFYRKE